ncbi:hypothetical protein C8Q77DRAFT_1246707 [Trametes polyzona]|nr:hypothetical protein C8Q77DRAFT_1246707 [Trametes polyzona]
MKELPTELYLTIFAFACTDGGRSACSLALTCRWFREIVRPLRFHSVILTGAPEQLETFHAQLQEARRADESETAAKVHHLFFRTIDITRIEDFNWQPQVPQGRRRVGRQYNSLVSTIMRAVAPTFETLVYIPDQHQPPLIAVFPCVRGLALATHRHPYTHTVSVSRPMFPALTHLHLLSGQMRTVAVEGWAYQAPRVTHLRICSIGDPEGVNIGSAHDRMLGGIGCWETREKYARAKYGVEYFVRPSEWE